MKEIKIVSLIFILFLTLRLILIFTFPPFVDESNYIWWGQLMLTKNNFTYASINIWGKQPLPFWLFGQGSLLLSNFVAGARLVSLVFSLPTFFVVYFLVKELKNVKTAIISLLFYTFCPLFIFFQSVALVDGLLFSLNILVLGILFKLWKKPNFTLSSLLGLLLGLSFWIKSTSIIPITLAYISLIYFLIKDRSKFNSARLLSTATAILLSLIFIFSLVRRSDFHLLLEYNQIFALSLNEILNFPLTLWINNFIFLFLTLLIYTSPLVLLGIFFIYKDINRKKVLFLLIWFIISMVSIILTSRYTKTRYFLFGFAPLLPLLALGTSNFLANLGNKYTYIKVSIFFLLIAESLLFILSPPLFFSLFPKNSLLQPERDYVFGWPSGYGIKEAINYFEQIRPASSVTLLGVPAGVGNNTAAYVLAYFRSNQFVKTVLIPTYSEQDFRLIEPLTKSSSLYFICNNKAILEEIKPFLKIVKIFNKPGNEDFIGLYQVKF